MLVGKHEYQGCGAELAAKAEIVTRGYNVADWTVEVGADFLVTRTGTEPAMRVEVKSTRAKWYRARREWRAHFRIPRTVIVDEGRPRLCLILAIRLESHWEYLIISRRELVRLYSRATPRRQRYLQLSARFSFTPTAVRGPGGFNYQRFRNNWSRYWPPVDRRE